MDYEKDKIKKFNRTNLVDSIFSVVHIEKKVLRAEVKNYIWPRLGFICGRRNAGMYYVFEEDYVETEWKDMISIHYIHTTYNVQKGVMRVHIFMREAVSEEFYLGFFTLRKIDEARIMLSFIYPNWPHIVYNQQPLYVMTYKKTTHVLGKEINFRTYPLFVQDNITVACAHVNIISMTQYLHYKYDYQKMRILDLNNAFFTGKGKLFPTTGLDPIQMKEIFNYYNIPVGYCAHRFNNGEEKEEKKCFLDEYHRLIDCSIESGIPVILGMDFSEGDEIHRHVIQIIGHTQQDRYKYVIYDDSGYFLQAVFQRNGFVGAVDWDTLAVNICHDKSFIIYPIHEKVFLLYEDFRYIFEDMFKKTLGEFEEYEIPTLTTARFLLADNVEIKKFLYKLINEGLIINDTLKEEINKILKMNMSHYVWTCEVPVQGGFFLYIADSTYGKLTSKNIFYNEIPIYTEKQFGLLNYK